MDGLNWLQFARAEIESCRSTPVLSHSSSKVAQGARGMQPYWMEAQGSALLGWGPGLPHSCACASGAGMCRV